MNLAQQAIEEADSVIAMVFGLARDAVRERRKMAEWYYVYRSRRAAYARTKVARRYWSWLARKSKAQMEANECCAVDEQLAKLEDDKRTEGSV